MEDNVLVDSSWFIQRYREGKDPFRLLEASDFDHEFYSCGVVMTEVCRGVRNRRLYEGIRKDFAVMCWVPTTAMVWELATDLAWELAGKGFTMQVTDLVIAASALTTDAMVLTLDSDFTRIPGLRVIDTLT
ncbi:MAG: PIN domain-containing protein [Verrucomicrobiaceae bacterium]|jgi:hypothetical protein|nr:PIN domain-containing protein [Verrucomicrobiaceae bacterium]